MVKAGSYLKGIKTITRAHPWFKHYLPGVFPWVPPPPPPAPPGQCYWKLLYICEQMLLLPCWHILQKVVFFRNNFMFLFCLVCMYMHGCTLMSPQKEVRKLGESALCFLHVDPRRWTEVIRLDGKCPFIGLYWEAICNPLTESSYVLWMWLAETKGFAYTKQVLPPGNNYPQLWDKCF